MDTTTVLAEVERRLSVLHPGSTVDDVMPGTTPGTLESSNVCTCDHQEELHYHTLHIGTQNWSAIHKALYAYKFLEGIKKSRNMPFLKLGMRVRREGRGEGILVGGNDGGNLNVRFGRERHISNCHPFDELVYYSDDGSIVADYRHGLASDRDN